MRMIRGPAAKEQLQQKAQESRHQDLNQKNAITLWWSRYAKNNRPWKDYGLMMIDASNGFFPLDSGIA